MRRFVIPGNTANSILVVESRQELCDRIKNLLVSQGFTVKTFVTSDKAMAHLEKFPGYTLIVSSYKMPEMKGDEILEQAGRIAPDIQRILMVEASEMKILVNAINIAGVQACLTLPFSDGDLINHVRHCCRQYEIVQKQKSLLRLTQRRNKQLFKFAASLKKKKSQHTRMIQIKNKQIRILTSRVNSGYALKPVLLKDILDKWNISFSPSSLSAQFLTVKNEIKKILETAAASASITLAPVSSRSASEKRRATGRHHNLVESLLPQIYSFLEQKPPPSTSGDGEKIFELTLSDENTRAFLQINTMDSHSMTVSRIIRFLEKQEITTGVAITHEIEAWLFKRMPQDPPFLIARGRTPRYPENAQVKYHFDKDFRHAGRIRKDGSIDFSDRGKIPRVEAGVLLAEKKFAVPGIPGIDVFGQILSVDEPVDLAFSAGPGTSMSEQGDKIFADISGQPHLDAMGNVSVCSEYKISGDLGFETGDIDFPGDVIVTGEVKPGFKVKCASLTAREIHGGQIDITGDLNVSYGIVDAHLINVKGIVQAKFVHNSTINAFGDLVVQKEIIDSTILLSGACKNSAGLIISSTVSAKLGIDTGTVGKPSAGSSTLKAGIDEHLNRILAAVDARTEDVKTSLKALEDGISQLQAEDHELHAEISSHAYVQDRSQLELAEIQDRIKDLQAAGDTAAVKKISKSVDELKVKAVKAEQDINKGFERQDAIAEKISQKRERIRELEETIKTLDDEKDRLLEFSGRKEPVPQVTVARKIEAGTRILSPNASLVLRHSASRCRIQEIARTQEQKGEPLFHELVVMDL